MRKVLSALAIIVGVGAAVVAVLAAPLYVALPWLGLDVGLSRLAAFAMAGALVTLGCGLGLPLAWAGLSALGNRPSLPLHWPHLWWLILLFLLDVVLGQAILSFAPLPWLFFPAAYVLSILLPAVVVVSLVGSRLERGGLSATWREVLAQVASGAFLGTSASLMLEMVLLLVLGLLVAAVLALVPGGLQRLQDLFAQIEAAEGVLDTRQLLPLLRSPWLVGAALLVVAVAAPAIEEAVKTLGVLVAGYRGPTRARAFLWGVAGGSAFALVEGLLNSALLLAEPQTWAVLVVMRASTVVVHGLAGGLVGLGWHALLEGRHIVRALKHYVQAVSLHGLWNALAAGAAFVQLFASGEAGEGVLTGLGAVGVAFLALLLLGLLVIGCLLLISISDSLAREQSLLAGGAGMSGQTIAPQG